MKALATLFFCVMLAGCATTEKYEKKLNTLTGAKADRVIDILGYPDSVLKLPNGNDVYVYAKSGSVTLPGQTTTTANAYGSTVYANSITTGGTTLDFWCKTFVEIDKATTEVVAWRTRGNNCISD